LYNENTGVATSPGKLKVDEPDNTLTGNTGTAYYKTRDVKIRDSVVIEIRPRAKDRSAPKGSTRSNFKEPVVINCQKVDYNWRTKIAEMTGNLIFKQKERTVTADRAVYNGKTETLTLFGNVEYKSVKGDKGYGDKAVAVLRDGAEQFEVFNLKPSEFYFEDEEEKETPAKPEPGEGTSPVPTNPAPPATQPGTSPAPSVPPTAPPTSPGGTPGNLPANTPAGSGRL
jgi:lipopolysaccharide export system protein LptA